MSQSDTDSTDISTETQSCLHALRLSSYSQIEVIFSLLECRVNIVTDNYCVNHKWQPVT